MPPIRRSRLLLTSHRQGRCGRRNKVRRRHDEQEGEGSGTFLPDDILGRVFAGLEPAAVVRCAATCRHWAGVVARDAATISRTLQPPLGRRLPDLAIGFFHQEKDGSTARTRNKRTSTSTAEPSFVPTASGRRRFGLQRCVLSSLVGGQAAGILDLDYSRPVASRNGRLVLELRREAYRDGLKLCVCNLLTGDTTMLPPLSGENYTTTAYYACALLTGEDLDDAELAGNPACFFRLLLVYNRRRGFTALRCYSSDTGCWGREARKPGGMIASEMLRRLGPAVVVRGVAYWSLNHAALGVRLTAAAGGELQSHDVRLLVYPATDPFSDARLLGVSPEGRLSYITACPRAGDGVPCVVVYLLGGNDGNEGDDSTSSTAVVDWEWLRPKIVLPQLRSMPLWSPEAIKMRWFCEKSGIVFFTLGGTTAGTYALNLDTHEVETLVDGQGFCWRNFCGYEIDHAAYLKLLIR